MFFNKPKKPKETKRVGKPPESVQFKNASTKKVNNSGYETIRSIVDKDEQLLLFYRKVIKQKMIIRISIIKKI